VPKRDALSDLSAVELLIWKFLLTVTKVSYWFDQCDSMRLGR